jgi:hypothetical protein
MPSSIQTDFDLTPPSERHPHRPVRETSLAQYADARDRFSGRKSVVLCALAAYFNRRQQWPTAAELTAFEWPHFLPSSSAGFKLQVLTVRRGLSDLQASGVVESHGARHCSINKRGTKQPPKVETWQIIPAGR